MATKAETVEQPLVIQMLRTVSKRNIPNPEAGLDTMAMVNAELTTYLQQGYKLAVPGSVIEPQANVGDQDNAAVVLYYVLVHKDYA